jgi:F-type H+-transporting ATPase subunit b
VIVAASGSNNFGLSYVLELVGIAITVALIWKYIAPPLGRAMNRRLDSIRGQLAAGETARAEGLKIVEQRTAELKAAEQEAKALIEQAKHSAELLVLEGQRRAEEERSRIVARTAVEIAAARARARHEVLADLGLVIVAATEVVVRAELNDASHHRLIDEAIAATESESTSPEVAR